VGFTTRRMEQKVGQGRSFSPKSVCPECVDDPILTTLVTEAASDEVCSFCGTSPSAPLDVLLERFVAILRLDYEPAIDGVGWDGREGGYQWSPQWDTYDLVWDVGGDSLVGPGLLEAVATSIEDTIWVERHFVEPRRNAALHTSWERFRHAVVHETRFVFWLNRTPEDDLGAGDIPATEILLQIGALVRELDLVKRLPAGSVVWRAQAGVRPNELTAARLGTVPVQHATVSNRMSPAGIPMFYGAEDPETARDEIMRPGSPAEVSITTAAFQLASPVNVADFSRLPPVPEYFDLDAHELRGPLEFLHLFVKELSKPIAPSDAEVDYVPTQVLTEYLLKAHPWPESVVGLRYTSSRNGRPCLVLDIPNMYCREQDEARDDITACLVLDTSSIVRTEAESPAVVNNDPTSEG
jgi:hypothetical protein